MTAIDNNWLVALSILVAVLASLNAVRLAIREAAHARLQSQRLEQVNAHLQHQASHDALTGLPNRQLLLARLQQAITRAGSGNQRFAIFLLDLDRFKHINDSLGHAAGDQLLIQVAQRLSAGARGCDTVSRIGGDEFLVLADELWDPIEIVSMVSKLVASLTQPYDLPGIELHTAPSIGISVYPADGRDVDTLVANADKAMYHAKSLGGGTFSFYDQAMDTSTREGLELESALRRALQLDQFELHYQPKVDIPTGRVRSVEALLRWRHPTRGMISPDLFIQVAERSGLIVQLGQWVMREACRQLREWQQAGLPFLRVAINVSAAQFRQPELLDSVQAALRDHGLAPRHLELELTETTVMANADSSVRALEQLSRLGIIITIDDFGTGYSSMSYLRRFPIDRLKIDRVFIRDLTTSENDAFLIVRAIISLAHSLKLKVVAEGVENEVQLRKLQELGCDQYQGYFFSQPLPADQMEQLLRTGVVPQAAPQATQHDDLDLTIARLAVLGGGAARRLLQG